MHVFRLDTLPARGLPTERNDETSPMNEPDE
jgi:hypothetical protein